MKRFVVYMSAIHVIEAEDEWAASELANQMAADVDALLEKRVDEGSTEVTRIIDEDEDGGGDDDNDGDADPTPVVPVNDEALSTTPGGAR